MNDTETSASETLDDVSLSCFLVRTIVAAYPETMTILAPLGIDLCCGGAHSLGEALSLHGIDQNEVLPRIASIIVESSRS